MLTPSTSHTETLDGNTVVTTEVISRADHNISRKDISQNALNVLYKLHEANYQAYLVGGGVRDLILGLKPKDFDIATDATPEQVKLLFKNSRIIGRRFKLAHVFFGREIIEVATFRANQPAAHENHCKNTHNVAEDTGMITRDNLYGTIEEDAIRRDFTINALYYNIADFSVVDFLGGVEDLHNRKMHVIGDPETRYREDPVRMLRAIRLSTKLDLKLATSTARPITEMATLLQQVSNARLWEESLKLFLAGHAKQTWQGMVDSKIAHALFPFTMKALESDNDSGFKQFIDNALISTDKRVQQSKPITPAFLFAVLLWHPLQQQQQLLENKGINTSDAFFQAAQDILNKQHQFISIPRRFSQVIREIWQLQHLLTKRRGKRAERLFEHKRFRAAYDFLVLRARPDSEQEKLANWWTLYQEVDHQQRWNMVKALNKGQNQGRKKPSPSRKSVSKQTNPAD